MSHTIRSSTGVFPVNIIYIYNYIIYVCVVRYFVSSIYLLSDNTPIRKIVNNKLGIPTLLFSYFVINPLLYNYNS